MTERLVTQVVVDQQTATFFFLSCLLDSRDLEISEVSAKIITKEHFRTT